MSVATRQSAAARQQWGPPPLAMWLACVTCKSNRATIKVGFFLIRVVALVCVIAAVGGMWRVVESRRQPSGYYDVPEPAFLESARTPAPSPMKAGQEDLFRGPAPDSYRTQFKVPNDIRHNTCKRHDWTADKYDGHTATIIMPYLNETWPRTHVTIASILAHTPPQLLEEILMVDDFNSEEWAHTEQLKALHPKVRIHRNSMREGLIRAKNIGVREARGSIIIFLEPHCIVQPYWIEPLFDRLIKGATIAAPVLDVIPETSMDEYYGVNMHVGGFDWAFEFNWYQLAPELNKSWINPDPYFTPAIAGGIFAMTKASWDHFGYYDEGMYEWGAEQIEMSLRVWQCGGTMEIIPCSRIGHVFRAHNPYTVHLPRVIKNQKRMALVWVDDHIEKFYKIKPQARHWDVGDVTERKELRKKLQCKSMDWYLENVYPTMRKQPDFVTQDWMKKMRSNGWKFDS
eukprot:CAMPEP_0204385072 /NCGR_PEP_ID=MMETSP0469-20131031/57405_1 /ASSEMBLY_ACC=CAM_ASM_000384 /TAXON_ID=2969 /ORGANISM="Oxyrrhis marina" /LENGTH=456 /DNA_ID=CAMNT_0051377901 /DNA_START=1 /DNA_END=1371 /DNA_ORIENTATION=+